jgi:hypothetical protein
MLLRRYEIDQLALRLDQRAGELRRHGAKSEADDLAIAAELIRERAAKLGGHEFGPEYEHGSLYGKPTMKELVLHA